jgi:hypothetical protein
VNIFHKYLAIVWGDASSRYHFMMSSFLGDLAWVADVFGFRNYRCNQCCHSCFAWKYPPKGNKELMVTNMHQNAGHKLTVQTHEDYIAVTPESKRSSWFDVKGMRSDRIMHDISHGQHLGTGGFAAGNALIFLCTVGFYEGWPSTGVFKTNMADKLRKAYASLRKWKKQHKIACSQPRFTPSRLSRASCTTYPVLAAKAANCKAVCFWLAEETALCVEKLSKIEDFPEDKLKEAKLVAVCLHHYVKFIHLLDANGRILSVSVANKVVHHGYRHLLSFAALSALSNENQTCMWG